MIRPALLSDAARKVDPLRSVQSNVESLRSSSPNSAMPATVGPIPDEVVPESVGLESLPGPQRVIPQRYHGHMAMTLRLTAEDEKALAALAEADGVSKQEATVRAIREAAQRRGHEDHVRRLSAQSRERYADLLDRLGR